MGVFLAVKPWEVSVISKQGKPSPKEEPLSVKAGHTHFLGL